MTEGRKDECKERSKNKRNRKADEERKQAKKERQTEKTKELRKGRKEESKIKVRTTREKKASIKQVLTPQTNKLIFFTKLSTARILINSCATYFTQGSDTNAVCSVCAHHVI